MPKKLFISIFILCLCASCQSTQPTALLEPEKLLSTTTTPLPSQTATPASTNTSVVNTATRDPTTTLSTTQSSQSALSGLIFFYSNRSGNPDIFSINLETNAITQLTDDPAFDDSPSVSPDGSRVLFLTARHDPDPKFPNLKYEIYVMDVDGENQIRLTFTDTGEDHPAWSPDGKKIIFDADYDGDGFYEIYTMQPDGTQLERLTNNPANDQFADWSPDGSQITFSSDRNGSWNIFIMNADGSNQKSLSNSNDWELFPAWSPDGSQIAFNRLAPRSRNTDVYVMTAEGSEILQLTNSGVFDENPVWSPDGKLIAFQTNRDGHFEIYVMNADGSDQHALSPNPADELWPSWGLLR